MNTLLSLLLGLAIMAGASYSMLDRAEIAEQAVLEYDAQRQADLDAVMKWRGKVKSESDAPNNL